MSSPSGSIPWRIVLPWEPWSKKRPRISKPVKGKPPRTHQDPEDKKAEDRTRDYLRRFWPVPVIGSNVRISVQFYRSTRQVIDIDNLLKHLHDAAERVIWVNDCQITAYGAVELHLDREDPRTDLSVEIHAPASMARLYDPQTGKAIGG